MNSSWKSTKTREYFSPYFRQPTPCLGHFEKHYLSNKPVQKINWRRANESFRRNFQIYSKYTTLHGFRYLSLDEVTFGGKIIWLIVCLVSFSLSIYLMFTAWYKYQITPTVTSIESTTHPIWGLRFPAVTICNYNKVYEPRANELASKMKRAGLNDSEIKDFFDAIPMLISEEYFVRDFKATQEILDRIGLGSTEQLMHRLMQPCNKLMIECSWLTVKYDCTKVFKTVRTAHGFCCAFNYHAIGGDYSPGGISTKNDNERNVSTLPGVHDVQMVPGAGRKRGLSVYINVEPRHYRGSIRPYVGAAILIHDPLIYPEINIQNFIVQPAQDVSVIALGNVIESAPNIRGLSLKRRKCWFHDEKKLNTTKEYSYQSCITECKMEHIFDHCRCLPFFYPDTMNSVKRCDLKDVQCLRAYSGFLNKMQTPFNHGKVHSSNQRSVVPECLQCLPPCSVNGYRVETETAVLTNDHNGQDKSSNLNKSEYSLVTVYFPDITCLKYRRETFMTWDNLLATFGGIFGLCIGGSVVSFVEIFYYIIVWLFRRKSFADKSGETAPVRIIEPVRQSVTPMKNAENKNWTDNEHFSSNPDYNFNDNKIAPRVIDFSQQSFNRAAVAIELSNTQTNFSPNFYRM